MLDLSLREEPQLGHRNIGTGHILLGLLRENESVGGRILLGFDLDLERIRSKVTERLPGDED